MSGGIAYVLDVSGRFAERCNQQMVDLEPLDRLEDRELVRALIEQHVSATGSDHAARVLDAWSDMAGLFVKVMPRDYKRVLAAQAHAAAEGRPVEFSELVGVAVARG
jgi:glutamate synthase (ferredoxin)